MTSKVTTLLRVAGVVDPGRVDDAGTERRDPEVPEKAKRRNPSFQPKHGSTGPATPRRPLSKFRRAVPQTG
jgi:hypothetical protein